MPTAATGVTETIAAADGKGVRRNLASTDVEQLVSAMAGMTPPTGATNWSALSASQQALPPFGVWR